MATAENMFKEAALIQLTATCWQLDKKLPQSMLADVGNVDFLRGRKLLLPPDSTANIKTAIGKARNYLRKVALPFPINGCMLVPKKLIPEIQEELKKIQWEYNSHVQDFLYWYPQIVKDAKNLLGELFDECDYPTKERIESRFRFQWRYIVVGPSIARVLPPSIYKEEVEKFQSLMEQAHIEAIATLRSRREAFSLASLDSAPSISEQISPSLSGQKIPSLTTTAKRDVAPCFMSMPTSSSAR